MAPGSAVDPVGGSQAGAWWLSSQRHRQPSIFAKLAPVRACRATCRVDDAGHTLA